MIRLLLILAFMATCFMFTGAKKDIVQGAVDTLQDGAALMKDVTNHTRIAVKSVEDKMKEIEKQILEISGNLSRLGIDSTELTYAAFVKFEDVMKALRLPETKLRTLMNKTKTISDKLQDILNMWDEGVTDGGSKTYIQEQV